MSTPFSASLSEYQRGARAVGAKSALPLAAAAAALASSAHGQVVVYTPTTHNVALLGSGHRTVFVDFLGGQTMYSGANSNALAFTTKSSYPGDTDGVTANFTFNFTGSSAFDGYPGRFARQPDLVNGGSLTHGGYGYLGKFARGTTIDGSLFGDAQPYLNPPNTGVAPVWANTTGYSAVQFANGSNIYYGWLKLAVNGDASQISLLAFGYNQTAGASITAGEGLTAAVPEPASAAALLAAGAGGLAIYRRRKQIVRAV